MKTRGFTLIELMIVVAIIGILAAIALPAYQRWANGGVNVSPTPAMTSGETVHRVDMNSPRCVNGVLLQNNEPVVKDGAAVKC